MQACQYRGDEESEHKADSSSIFCNLTGFDWYWGNITRPEVEYLLLKYPGNVVIRACNDIDHILCVSFRLDSNSCIKGTSGFSHIRLKHYKGMFSLDKEEYVPLEKIPEHCEKVGRKTKVFDAKVLMRDENTLLEIKKVFF